jgi:hypothetical protein
MKQKRRQWDDRTLMDVGDIIDRSDAIVVIGLTVTGIPYILAPDGSKIRNRVPVKASCCMATLDPLAEGGALALAANAIEALNTFVANKAAGEG